MDLGIEVNYGYDGHTLPASCDTNIYDELHDMQPGAYTIVAADDETQIDLYDYLTVKYPLPYTSIARGLSPNRSLSQADQLVLH